jgi:hypothetical protein
MRSNYFSPPIGQLQKANQAIIAVLGQRKRWPRRLGAEVDFSLPANLQTADMSGGGMVPISLPKRLAVFLNSGSFAPKRLAGKG